MIRPLLYKKGSDKVQILNLCLFVILFVHFEIGLEYDWHCQIS